VNRGLAYAVLTAAASAVIIAILHTLEPRVVVNMLGYHSDILIVVLVVLLLVSTPAQRIITRTVDPYLFRGRTDHAAILQFATHRLNRLMQPDELAAELRHLFIEAFVPEYLTVLIIPAHGGSHSAVEVANKRLDLSAIEELLPQTNAPGAIVVTALADSPLSGETLEILHALQVEVIVTLGRRGQLLGAVLLGQRRSGDAYFKNDLTFLESVAELASVTLENSLLYRQRIEMLEYSERLLASLDSAVVAVDVEGQVTSFNVAAKSLLGLREDHRGIFLNVLPSEVAWALAFALMTPDPPLEGEAVIDTEQGALLPIILSTSALRDDRRRVTGALAVVTDLSTVKALEREQRRGEHLATMARFYAGVAHEIRSPLAAISNFISMLPDRFDDPEYRDTASRLLPGEVARIVRLADRLRLMAPSEGGKLSPVNLRHLLDDLIAIHAPTAKENSVDIHLDCTPDLPPILGDPSQLVQLFLNLLRNAIEAMPNGGRITLTASPSRGSDGHERITVRVLDEGVGVEPALRHKIFEPFFTTKPAGTGLGLSICKEIADFHRARLDLLPRSDTHGTIAQIEFPRAPANELSDRVPSEATLAAE
jgi:signal transduction histidine kinase